MGPRFVSRTEKRFCIPPQTTQKQSIVIPVILGLLRQGSGNAWPGNCRAFFRPFRVSQVGGLFIWPPGGLGGALSGGTFFVCHKNGTLSGLRLDETERIRTKSVPDHPGGGLSAAYCRFSTNGPWGGLEKKKEKKENFRPPCFEGRIGFVVVDPRAIYMTYQPFLPGRLVGRDSGRGTGHAAGFLFFLSLRRHCGRGARAGWAGNRDTPDRQWGRHRGRVTVHPAEGPDLIFRG